MKGVTEYTDTSEGILFSTYIYSSDEGNENRQGQISIRDNTIQNTGTFCVSFHNLNIPIVIASEYAGVTLYNQNLTIQKHIPLPGPAFKHHLHNNNLFVSSSLGRYYQICLQEKEKVIENRMQCNNTSCIHEVWSIFADDKNIYLGCDLGTFSIISRESNIEYESYKPHKTNLFHSFASGVTWIGPSHVPNTLIIGTYSGEYSFIPINDLSSDTLININVQTTNNTFWKVYPLIHKEKRIYIVAQAYDGVGVYTEQMKIIKILPTDDLIYSLLITNNSEHLKIEGYTYYQGKKVILNLPTI